MISSLYEPFKNWAEKGSIYIISDTHFDDPDCKLMDPGWITPEEQVQIINKTVMKNDTFIHLGDVGEASYINDIHAGKKILLLGNHDRKSRYTGAFDEIYDGPLFIAPRILLSHEPIIYLPWCLNIHGHDHGEKEWNIIDGNRLNMAANVCGYTPVNLGKLIKQGALSTIPNIHRFTIDVAITRKEPFMDWEPELGNILYGNSRGNYPIHPRRKFEKAFEETLGEFFDGYGYIKEDRLSTDRGGFQNEIFSIEPYYWGDDEDIAILPNFVYKPSNIEMSWYKYPFRDAYSNIMLTPDEARKIFEICADSMRR